MNKMEKTPLLNDERRWVLSQAAYDFYFFQNRLYPRKAALEWVGNRYRLSILERQLLHRGVFSQGTALGRRSRKVTGGDLRNQRLLVDGHNVQITVESAILERPLVKANDGAMRDLAGQSSRYRLSDTSELAADMIFHLLELLRPRRVDFLFDAPMSQSGMLAAAYRRRLNSRGMPGEARTVPVPEREMDYGESIIASSDQAILESSSRWLDLAHEVVDASCSTDVFADFSRMIMANPLSAGD